MDVIIEPQGGEPFPLELGFFDTVLEIKEKVQKYYGIPASRQTLFFNGHLLQDNCDVPSIQIFYKSRLQLIISPDPPPFEAPPQLINIEDSPPSINHLQDVEPPPPPPPPPPPSTKIQLLLRLPTSKILLSIEMDLAHTVGKLKEKIHEMEGIPVHRIMLHSSGRDLLQDNRSLHDCELADRSEINVAIKPLPPPSGSGPKKLKLMVMSKCGTKKVPVEVNPSDNVGELRKELEKLDQRFQFHLPPEGYFFIYKQNVMDDDRSFRWHHVGQGDIVEIFNGCVTGGS